MKNSINNNTTIKKFEWAIFLFAILLYGNTLFNQFALDDIAVIQQNKFTQQGLAGIDDMLLTFYWEGYWDTNAGLYRPLSLITFAVEYQFFGKNPMPYHATNILLYGVVCVLLYRLLRELFKERNHLLSFIAVLLFTAHAVHTEVVANIKSRDELLSVLFVLITAKLFIRYQNKQESKILFLATGTHFLAMFAKEGAIVFTFIYPLIAWYFSNTPLKNVIKSGMVFLIPAISFYALHSYVISNAVNAKVEYSYWDNALVAAEGVQRYATAIYMLGKYYLILLFPHPLSYDYSFNEIPAVGFGNLQVIVTILVSTALGVIALRGLKNKTVISFCILFFAITFALTSNLIMLIGATMADRFLFTPSIGFCIALAWLMHKSAKKTKKNEAIQGYLKARPVATSILVIFLIGNSVKTMSRNLDWKNNFTLFEQDVNASPNSSRTQYNYGTELLNLYNGMPESNPRRENTLAKAIYHLERSVKIDTNAYQSYLNLASAYYQQKRYQDAANMALKNLSINPNEAKAHSVAGNAFYRLNNFDASISHLERSIAMNFVSDDTYVFLGGSYFGKGNFNMAIRSFNKALELKPDNVNALTNLGAAYGSIKAYPKAIETFRKIVMLSPGDVQNYYNMAFTFNNMQQPDSANKYLGIYNAMMAKNKR